MEKKNEKTVVRLSSSTEEKIIDKIVDLAQYMGETKFYPYQAPFARRLAQSIITNEGATISALFARQCLAKGSLILDRNGKVLPIEKHPDAWETKTVTELYEIKTFGGHVIRCTEEHPIATDQGWMPAQCVTKGTKVVALDQWDKFGDGKIPYGDKTFSMNDDLAELVGWLVANIKGSEEVKITIGHARVQELIEKYFLDSDFVVRKSNFTIRLTGRIKNFLKYIIKFDKYGIPEGINYFTREQLIRFFYPLFLTNGKTYKKSNTMKIVLKGMNTQVLLFYKEHLNKLGMHGNLEVWIGDVLIFQCTTNYLRFKELFEEYLPNEFFPAFFRYRTRNIETFEGEDGEILVYSRVHSVKKIQKETSVWDINIPEKGWFLASGTKVHNSGKTQIVAMVTAALMVILPSLAEKFPDSFDLFKKGLWVGCFGPIGEQAITMFDRIYDILTTDSSKRLFIEELKMPIPARGGARGNLIRLGNKSFVRYMSGSKRSKVESKTYHLILLDECQDMEAFKIRKCFAEGTEVWLPNGDIVPIEKVVKEKLDVITPDGPKTPNEWYDNGVQDVWRVTTATGKCVEVTENHRFLIRRRIGNRQAKFDILANLKVGDTIAAPLEVPYFGDKWTYEEGLLTGLMLGDGCFTGGQPRFCGMELVVNRLEELMIKDCSVRRVKPQDNGLIECGIRGNGTGNHVTNFFKELGLWSHKGDTKFIPTGGSKEFLRGVIEGLIETDGCIHWNSIWFNSISEQLVKDMQKSLLRFGIHGVVSNKINNGNFGNSPKIIWGLNIKDSISCIKFSKEFKLITKQEKLLALSEHKSKKIPRLQAIDKRRKHDRRLTFEFVKSIEYIGKKPTYCVNVDTHLLVTNGLMNANSILPMGAAVNATVVTTGTPDVYIGYFYDTIEQNRAYDLKNPSNKQMHFEVDYTLAQKYNTYYKKYIQKEIKRLGFDSDEFKMAYRLIWPITKGMVFTKAQLDEKCYDKALKTVKMWKESPCVAGLDLGKTQDSTVVTVIRPIWEEADEEGNTPKFLLNWLELEGDNWEDQYPQVVDFLNDYWIETLVCDTTGVGDPIRERYSVLLPTVNVVPFVFSPSSKDIGYKYFIQEVNNKRFIIPAHVSVRKTVRFKKFEQQMTTLKKHYTGKFLNPCPIDKDKGHDDYCVSEDTEILTARGFATINDIQYNDLIVNYNLNGSLTYSVPKRIIKDTDREYMVSLEGPYVSQLLTNNHKILYEYLTKENGTNLYKQKIGYSQDALNRTPNSTFRLLCSGIQSQPDYNISDEEIQLGAWMITEGWISKSKKWNDTRYQLGQSERKYPKKVKMIDSLVEKLGLSYNRYVRKDGLVMWQFRKESKSFFDNLLIEGVHTIPRNWIAFFSQRQLQLLLDTLMLGDGTISRNTYHTKDKKHAEDIQELAFRVGKQASIKFQINKKAGMYNVYIRNEHIFGTLSKISKVENYRGRTWCVTVDSGFIVIRRNGKVSITGNCDSSMLAVFGTYFEVMPDVEETMGNTFFNSTRDNIEQVFGRNYSRPRK